MAPVWDGDVLLETCVHACVLETPICSCNKERLNLPRGHFAWLCKALVQRRLNPSLSYLRRMVCCASWPATPFVLIYDWFLNRCTLVRVMVNAHSFALQIKRL